MRLPDPVSKACGSFLELVPRGLVTGLYLRGGTGFGEWVEGRSDVDFVATLSRRPSDAEVEQLREVHEQLSALFTVPFDGMHVLVDDLARDPRTCPDVPSVLHGHFTEGTGGSCSSRDVGGPPLPVRSSTGEACTRLPPVMNRHSQPHSAASDIGP